MKKLNLAIIFVVLLMSSSLVVNTAHATTGWMTNPNPKLSHSTLNQIGKTKICGDHICGPFEYGKLQKTLVDAQKKNQAANFFKQKNTK
ncbi:MAG TPA: hypothetical protein VFP45_00900 [Candidatus Nitrosotalea sp.]|nr:hypothetical protein [Candidatus Nitrosotalea sp.]